MPTPPRTFAPESRNGANTPSRHLRPESRTRAVAYSAISFARSLLFQHEQRDHAIGQNLHELSGVLRLVAGSPTGGLDTRKKQVARFLTREHGPVSVYASKFCHVALPQC